MELKNFNDFLAEAKDTQKDKENADMKKNDASHGNKSDNLDPSINEDAQKAKENADMKKNDASHGEKAGVVKEGEDKGKVLHGEKDCDDEMEKELEESLSSTEKSIIDSNNSRKRGDKVLIGEKEMPKSVILSASKDNISFAKGSSSSISVYDLTKNEKNVVHLSADDFELILKNTK